MVLLAQMFPVDPVVLGFLFRHLGLGILAVLFAQLDLLVQLGQRVQYFQLVQMDLALLCCLVVQLHQFLQVDLSDLFDHLVLLGQMDHLDLKVQHHPVGLSLLKDPRVLLLLLVQRDQLLLYLP